MPEMIGRQLDYYALGLMVTSSCDIFSFVVQSERLSNHQGLGKWKEQGIQWGPLCALPQGLGAWAHAQQGGHRQQEGAAGQLPVPMRLKGLPSKALRLVGWSLLLQKGRTWQGRKRSLGLPLRQTGFSYALVQIFFPALPCLNFHAVSRSAIEFQQVRKASRLRLPEFGWRRCQTVLTAHERLLPESSLEAWQFLSLVVQLHPYFKAERLSVTPYCTILACNLCHWQQACQ